MALRRLFSSTKLASIARQNLNESVQMYYSLTHNEKSTLGSELGVFTTELLKHQGTTPVLEDIIKFRVQNNLPPVQLPMEAKTPLIDYFQTNLRLRQIRPLNISIHFLWHNFPNHQFPFNDITSLLISNPTGSEKNKEEWSKLAVEMCYYAFPDQMNRIQAKRFLQQFYQHDLALVALAKFSLYTDSEDYTMEQVEEILEQRLSALWFEQKEYSDYSYELCRNFVMTKIHENWKKGENIFPDYFMSFFLHIAISREDWETVFRIYYDLQGIERPPSVFGAALLYLIQGDSIKNFPEYFSKIDEEYQKQSDEYDNTDSLLFDIFTARALVEYIIYQQDSETLTSLLIDLGRFHIAIGVNTLLKAAQLAQDTGNLALAHAIQYYHKHPVVTQKLKPWVTETHKQMESEGLPFKHVFDFEEHYRMTHYQMRPILDTYRMFYFDEQGEKRWGYFDLMLDWHRVISDKILGHLKPSERPDWKQMKERADQKRQSEDDGEAAAEVEVGEEDEQEEWDDFVDDLPETEAIDATTKDYDEEE